ncbi:MAG: hypothetical protein Q9162_002285 [Coniocarpon cinnabarinum]
MHWTLIAALLLNRAYAAGPIPTAPPFATSNLYTENFPAMGVRIGDSPDLLYVEFDTGSNKFWVNPAVFTTNSSTVEVSDQTFDLHYVIGEASGHVATDSVHIGESTRLDLTPTRTFGWADTTVAPSAGAGGLIGMSLDTNANDFPPGWQMLQPNLQPAVVGVRMQHPVSSSVSTNEVCGQFDWGGPDPQYVQQGITYSSVVPDQVNSTWTINFQGANVNGNDLRLPNPQRAFLDSKFYVVLDFMQFDVMQFLRLQHVSTAGSTGIFATNADALKINTALGGGQSNSSGSSTYYVPCDLGSAVLEISIEGVSYPVPNYLLIQGMCGSWVQGGESWTLGSGFLQAVYAVWDYDNKQVGFASVPPLTSGSATTSLAPSTTSIPVSSSSPTTSVVPDTTSQVLPPVSSTGLPPTTTPVTETIGSYTTEPCETDTEAYKTTPALPSYPTTFAKVAQRNPMPTA